MNALISAYISSIQTEFNTGQSTEHSFRSALKTLLESIAPNILALNESQRITGVGMPDFTIKNASQTTINIGWIEAKDLYIDLDEKKNSDQLWRYPAAFDNFIYTNNLSFQFYRNGKKALKNGFNLIKLIYFQNNIGLLCFEKKMKLMKN